MKINWSRVAVCTILCGILSGAGISLVAGLVGVSVGFVVILAVEALV